MKLCIGKDQSEIKSNFHKHLQKALARLTPKSELTKACEYSLSTPGKRLRPLLLLVTAKSILNEEFIDSRLYDALYDGAVAVEMFHTASLIADDLPTMDNDEMRRGMPSLHVKFGEATAIMASYALISEGYSAIYRATMKIAELGLDEAHYRGLLCVESIAQNAGIQGATGGQFLDINAPEATREEILAIHKKKTASIFEISLVLGWLFAGGAIDQLRHIQRLAHSFGTAFQIADDLLDYAQDLNRPGTINYATLFGRDSAAKLAHELDQDAAEALEALGLGQSALAEFLDVARGACC